MNPRDDLLSAAAQRGKYSPLYAHLLTIRRTEWRTTFGELEGILGFPLPDSARLHRPWWSNQTNGGGHSQAFAWQAAGWKTQEVDMHGETLVFIPAGEVPSPELRRRGWRPISEVLPVHDAGPWPSGFTASRDQIYGDDGR